MSVNGPAFHLLVGCKLFLLPSCAFNLIILCTVRIIGKKNVKTISYTHSIVNKETQTS